MCVYLVLPSGCCEQSRDLCCGKACVSNTASAWSVVLLCLVIQHVAYSLQIPHTYYHNITTHQREFLCCLSRVWRTVSLVHLHVVFCRSSHMLRVPRFLFPSFSFVSFLFWHIYSLIVRAVTLILFGERVRRKWYKGGSEGTSSPGITLPQGKSHYSRCCSTYWLLPRYHNQNSNQGGVKEADAVLRAHPPGKIFGTVDAWG